MSLLPLNLFGEVTTPSGARFKWDANQEPGSQPQNFSFRTKIGEGFSDASLQLARRIDRDYPDLELVNNVVFTGADGTVAYEGRITAMPRDLAERHSIGVTTAGWMAHAKDRKFTEAYADRSTDFGEGPLPHRQLNASGSISQGDFGWQSERGGLSSALPNQALGAQTLAGTWKHYTGGTKIATVVYRGTTTTLPAGWVIRLRAMDDPTAVPDVYALTLDDTLRSVNLTTAREYIGFQVYSNATPATPAAGSLVNLTKLGFYGSHGLAVRDGEPAEPPGLLLSDIMQDIVQRWCPQLDMSGIVANPYVVQHCAFLTPTFPYDAILELNKYALWHLGVWEGKRFDFRPYDLSDYDWEIRTDDPGTTFSPQGPSTADLFNGIVVTYTDILTGIVTTLSPSDYAELTDTSATNPWNAHGIDHWDEITLSVPTLTATALELGRAALADRNRPRTPGTISVRGYIRDRSGNRQPAWKVRAGDTISITNFPNDTPRLIVETDYSDDDKSARLSIDRPFALLDAYLDRQQNALGTKGLA